MNDTMIEPLTTEEIEQIRYRNAARTPGRWAVGFGYDQEDPGAYVYQNMGVGSVVATGLDPIAPVDAEYIAHCPEDMERLLATIDARDKTIAERDAEIARLREERVEVTGGAFVKELSPKEARFILAWRRSPLSLGKLIIAALNRYAVGAGVSLTSIADASLVEMCGRYAADIDPAKP